MSIKRYTFFLLLLLVFPSKALIAQTVADTTSKVIRPLHIEEDFDITGTLSNSIWKRADVAHIEYEVAPDDEAPAPVRTEVRVLYSNNNLYFGFIGHDPNPSKIRSSIAERDNVFGDDYMGVILDTYGNRQQAYEFFVNPEGIQFDAFRSSSGEDASFEALWYSEAAINDTGYTVVIKVPLKSLNFSGSGSKEWTVQFFRNYPRSVRHQLAWTNLDQSDACLLCKNGELVNLKGLESENTIEFLPYLVGYQRSALNDSEDPTSGLDHGPAKARLGGSISYAPTSTMSLNAVINPDFSQVETDAAQIGINESFALFFPEKRPFFLERASLFETSADLFYSRTINDPLAAGKLTQNRDDFSIAFLTAYDQNTPFIVPGLNESSNVNSKLNSYSNILRGKYDFGPETFVGGLITTRNFAEGSNYVGSIDWQIRLTEKYYVEGQVGYSSTKELNDSTLFNASRNFGRSAYDAAFNGEQYGGSLITLELERQAKYYNAELEFESFSPTFQSQNGFINQTNRRDFSLFQSLSYYPNKKWLSQGELFSFADWEYDFTGQLQERFIDFGVRNEFAGQTSFELSYLLLNDERFRGRFFTGVRRWSIEMDTNPLEELSLGGEVNAGKFIFRSQNPMLGDGYNISAEATLKPLNRLQFELSYNYSTLSSIDDRKEFFSGNILRMTGRYHFSRELFFRLITQYNSFNEQIQIYPLIYYQLNPFTKFYAGMTDNLRHFNQSAPGSFEGYKEIDRQFFIKFQYFFRY